MKRKNVNIKETIKKRIELRHNQTVFINKPIIKAAIEPLKSKTIISDDVILYDIIIPSWNMSEYAIRCLLTIKEYSKNYKVIFVDNGSEESEFNKIYDVLKTMPHVLIRNTENVGFIGATNMGIKISTSDYVVLMNNDTEAVDSWLIKLSAPLSENSKIGASGPLTTASSCWQGRYVKKDNKDYIIRHSGMLAFFCAMFKREIFSSVGILDEDFGVGFGDDDDFCHRIFDAGYKLALVQNLIIPHHHRTTFKHIYGNEKIVEMQNNAREQFLNKYRIKK